MRSAATSRGRSPFSSIEGYLRFKSNYLRQRVSISEIDQKIAACRAEVPVAPQPDLAPLRVNFDFLSLGDQFGPDCTKLANSGQCASSEGNVGEPRDRISSECRGRSSASANRVGSVCVESDLLQ
jgi:hypothetical protein